MQTIFNKRSINWTNSIYLIFSPFLALWGLYHWLSSASFNYYTLVLAFVLYVFCQISITAGYHRLFAHRSFNARWPVKLFFLIFGAAAFEGSAIHWSLDHRDHHNYVDDNQKDPYSIGKGFLWAHMGWLIFKQDDQLYKASNKAGDLYADPLLVWQMKYWVVIGAFVTFILPSLFALLWHDFFGGLFIAGLLRSVLNHHATFLINSLAHILGKQTYSDKHSARDNLFTAILTFGEGYHNYHHEFPSDYRNGVRPWDWDPTKWVIKALYLLNLTSDLKTIHEEIIIRKRTQMKEKRMHRKLDNVGFKFLGSTQAQILEALKSKYEQSFQVLSELRSRMQRFKTTPKLGHKASNKFVKIEMANLKQEINLKRYEFQKSIREWNTMRRRILAYVRA